MRFRFHLSVLMIAGVAAFACADSDLHLVLKSLYPSRHLASPMRVNVVNDGEATQATLTFINDGNRYSFPVSIPAHATFSKLIFSSEIGYSFDGVWYTGQI